MRLGYPDPRCQSQMMVRLVWCSTPGPSSTYTVRNELTSVDAHETKQRRHSYYSTCFPTAGTDAVCMGDSSASLRFLALALSLPAAAWAAARPGLPKANEGALRSLLVDVDSSALPGSVLLKKSTFVVFRGTICRTVSE